MNNKFWFVLNKIKINQILIKKIFVSKVLIILDFIQENSNFIHSFSSHIKIYLLYICVYGNAVHNLRL
jgi:hypothetical protein